MNVFGSYQAGETNKFVANLEQIVKSYLNKLDKFENSVKEQREQIVTFQSLQIDYMKIIDVSLQHIKENIDKLKNNYNPHKP